MRISRAAWVPAIMLVTGAGLPFVSTPASAAAAVGSDLYVANTVPCSDTGTGAATNPFCTISAAATAVQPGQTVHVEPGVYKENVHITRSGTSAAPITFVAETSPLGFVRVGDTDGSVHGTVFSVSHAQNVTLKGFVATGADAEAFLVSDSSDITIAEGAANGASTSGVAVTGASSRVTVRQMYVVSGAGTGPGVRIDKGVTGATVTTNSIYSGKAAAAGVLVTDAPGTVVTSNTVVGTCNAGIALAGASTGSVVQNNIVQSAVGPIEAPGACRAPVSAPAIAVSAGSATGTVLDYNLVDPTGGGPIYQWNGSLYATPAALAAATAQGGHDLVAPAKLRLGDGGDLSWIAIDGTSPAVDSANADAPGELPGDLLNHPRQDSPAVANTGAGRTSYADRGAFEVGGGETTGSAGLAPAPSGGPLDIVATVTGQSRSWTASGPAGFSYAVTFDGDPFPVVGSEASVRHTAHRAGEQMATVAISTDGFRSGQRVEYPTRTTVGAAYTPVTPTRLLDTRARIGTPTTTPVPAGGDLLLPITELGGVPTADLTAVVVNVTVSDPTDTGFLTVYPDGRAQPDSSNVNFTPGRTVPNLVTVPVDGKGIRFHNSSSGTVHVVADLAGFYSGQGSGFKPFAPTRVLDTRAALGTSGTTPLAAGDRLRLDLSGQLPAGATAAVLNLTATEATTAGFLTAYPAGQSLPNASNVNFAPGLNIANLAVVPVVDGKIDIRNSSSGTVHVVADLEGYYGTAASGATQTFVPTGPNRIADTRSGLGVPQAGAVPARGSITVGAPPYDGCAPTCPTELLNVTVTDPADAGFLTVHPSGQQTPTASNLNFTQGATVPNLVSVPKGTDGRIRIFNGSFGTVHIVVDQEGYFFDARK